MSNNKAVSIIIPTFNRSELLELTLLSLYEQSIPAQNFEVIVVDDNSSDSTLTVLEGLKPPFQLEVLHNACNQGAAYSRNRGIKSSKGEIIIFLDEMLVRRDFIAKHLTYHNQEKMVVTTHFNGQKIFTHYYLTFSKKQKGACSKILHKRKNFATPTDKEGVYRLFSEAEVLNQEVFRFGSITRILPKWFKALQASYGEHLESMATPWFLFITNGVSLPRELLFKAGLFDEKLKGAWMEDWELGYRLYQAGAKFYNAKDIVCCHQTHPISRRIKDKLVNCLYFSEKYPIPEVLLIPAMSAIFNWSVPRLANIITQYKDLKATRCPQYLEFVKAFEDLTMVLRLHVEKIVSSTALPLLSSCEEGFTRWEPAFATKAKEQLRRLESETFLIKNYLELTKGFKDLLHLPIDC